MADIKLPCPACGVDLQKSGEIKEDEQGRPLAIELYQCVDASCGRKAVLMFEPKGGLSADQRGFVEREIARHGAFFPSDYTGSHRGLR